MSKKSIEAWFTSNIRTCQTETGKFVFYIVGDGDECCSEDLAYSQFSTAHEAHRAAAQHIWKYRPAIVRMAENDEREHIRYKKSRGGF